MNQEIFDWLLLLLRWLHITVAVTWIGTSIFFMWLDRSFLKNSDKTHPGHLGELWMVHGGGFYFVEKMKMGPTEVPKVLHWFKWESYWSWISGMALLVLIFYTGGGTFLLDPSISDISFTQGILIGLGSIFVSWFFYDFLWESSLTKKSPLFGHLLTIIYFIFLCYFLTHTLSGRAAYIHIGAIIGTWMVGNVLMRIIPRQVKMVEASKSGEEVNQEWAVNAKNRSTHNTYFTLPIIFIMLSNHFPSTYGHELNWIILLLLSLGGALIREYFVTRLTHTGRSKTCLIIGLIAIVSSISISKQNSADVDAHQHHEIQEQEQGQGQEQIQSETQPLVDQNQSSNTLLDGPKFKVTGLTIFNGQYNKSKKLRLPLACSKQIKGTPYSREVLLTGNKLKNVFIQVVQGHRGKYTNEIPKQAVEVDQSACFYRPRVSVSRVGQEVVFINSDKIFHNVKSVTKKNKRFNIAMPKYKQRKSRVFTKPEIFVQTKCSVHPWMKAYIAVVDHPFYAVSDEQGSFDIHDLPPGKYTLEAWHEVFGKIQKQIEITDQDLENIQFEFKE